MSNEAHGSDKGKGANGDKPSEAATFTAATAPPDATNGTMAHAGLAENEAAAGNNVASATTTYFAAAAAENMAASAKATSQPTGGKKAASTTSDHSAGAKSSKRGRTNSSASASTASAPPSNAPKEIEVLDPALNYQQVRILKSVSEGNRVMGVSRHMLSKICDSGGGVINSDKFGTKYFYRYTHSGAAAKAPAAGAVSKAKVGHANTAGPGSNKQHLTAAALKRHDESHQYQHQQHLQLPQYQPQVKQPTGGKVGKQTEPPKQAAAASSQFYGGTFPFYSSQSGPPPPSAIGYLNASILRATMSAAAASAPRQEAKSTLPRPSTAASSAASNARMVSYAAYPPTQFPSVEEIEASIPANASSIFHVLDRRINFDNFSNDASFYSLLRAWVQDDPYRCDASMHRQLLAGGDWVQINEDNSVERPKKRQRSNGGPVDVLALLQQQKGSMEQPNMVELRREHVARAKEIQSEARKLDRLKMVRAKESLERRYGVTL